MTGVQTCALPICTAWCLRAIGRAYSEQDVVAGLGPERISPVSGLLDASGAGLVEWLGEIGVTAANNPSASWEECQAAAGYQPLLLGGRAWCHWTAVRMGSLTAFDVPDGALILMNPAPGWMGVQQVMWQYDFDRLGDFSAVWLTSW